MNDQIKQLLESNFTRAEVLYSIELLKKYNLLTETAEMVDKKLILLKELQGGTAILTNVLSNPPTNILNNQTETTP